MPLPTAPTRKPQSSAKSRASNDLLFKGMLCSLIGLGVLLSPRFMASSSMQSIVANASWVGWFALVLGVALIGLFARQRLSR